MRNCTDCNREDAPWLEDAPCNCGCPEELAAMALEHQPQCRALGHQVVFYPVRIERRDLTYNAGAEPVLDIKWTRKGWRLKRDGKRYYRVKLLCRDCIGKETDAQARKREYEAACKKSAGIETMTYAQMLASQ